MRLVAITALLALVGCASSPVGPVRYQNAPPVWQVNDRLDIDKPERRKIGPKLYHLDGFFLRRITRALEVPESRRAMNTNSLDEVPDSTWFTNRIGRYALTPDDIRRGPNRVTIDLSSPWQVTGTKVGGASVGMLIKDAAGARFLLKFDEKGIPEAETAADVIGQRILWAMGFNVPEDDIVTITRDRLVLAEDAVKEDVFGNKSEMTEQDVDELLEKVNRGSDGSYRALVSKFLSGWPAGGFAQEGVRPDDANDQIPHEHRRDVRAWKTLFGWISHTDIKEDNTLDMWVPDPADPERHYLKHYLVDFGKALGVYGFVENQVSDGYTHTADVAWIVGSIFTLGLYQRPWEGVAGPGIPGVARFEADRFAPQHFEGRYPYIPLGYADRFDNYWGAKIVMRFSPDHIRAAVEQGKYSDPLAADYIVQTLIARQRKIGRYRFTRVNPIDSFVLGDDGLCFEDLLLKYRLNKGQGATRYRARGFDFDGRATGWEQELSLPDAPGGCFEGFEPAKDHDGYTIIFIETLRHSEADDEGLDPVEVHLARGEKGLRVVGVRRH